VPKCVRGKKTFRDMEVIFKKVNYIYKCKWMCVVRRKKWRTKLTLSKRKKHSARRGKTNSSKENSQFKSVKTLTIPW
jgi:hypothetical protein